MEAILMIIIGFFLGTANAELLTPHVIPSHAPLSEPAAKVKVIREIEREFTDQYTQMLAKFSRLGGKVWANEDGLTPQQVFDAFDANHPGDACKLRRAGIATIAILNSTKPGSVSTADQHLSTTMTGTGADCKVTAVP